VSLEFAVLDFADPRRHRYEYRLGEGAGGWTDLGPRREITFADMEPGRYIVRVRGRNGQGVWSEIAEPVRLRIVPPFWMTAWFRLVAGTPALGAFIGGHRARTASLTRRTRELTILKAERERALEGAAASRRRLTEAYQRLRLLTRRLEAAK